MVDGEAGLEKRRPKFLSRRKNPGGMIYYTSAFLLGLLGSFHCAGMCGPIALALPLDQSSRMKIVAGRMMYNGGRILTYMMLGVIAGLIGHGIAYAGFQKTLSISAGLLML